jgi:hypothetical protein
MGLLLATLIVAAPCALSTARGFNGPTPALTDI